MLKKFRRKRKKPGIVNSLQKEGLRICLVGAENAASHFFFIGWRSCVPTANHHEKSDDAVVKDEFGGSIHELAIASHNVIVYNINGLEAVSNCKVRKYEFDALIFHFDARTSDFGELLHCLHGISSRVPTLLFATNSNVAPNQLISTLKTSLSLKNLECRWRLQKLSTHFQGYLEGIEWILSSVQRHSWISLLPKPEHFGKKFRKAIFSALRKRKLTTHMMELTIAFAGFDLDYHQEQLLQIPSIHDDDMEFEISNQSITLI